MLYSLMQENIPAIRAVIKNPFRKDSFITISRGGAITLYSKKKGEYTKEKDFIFTDAKKYPTLPHFLLKNLSSFVVGGDDGLVKEYGKKSGSFYENPFPPLVGKEGFLAHVFCGAAHESDFYAFGIDDEMILFFTRTKKGELSETKRKVLPKKDTLYGAESVGDFFIFGGELGTLYTYTREGEFVGVQNCTHPIYDIKKYGDFHYVALTAGPALILGNTQTKRTKKIPLPEKGEVIFFDAFSQTLYFGTDSGNVFGIDLETKKISLIASCGGAVTALTTDSDSLIICGEKWIDILEM